VPQDFIISSDRVVIDDRIVAATVVIENGRIASILPGPPPHGTLDLSGLVLMPGLVDTHVHVNEPGRTDWEGFETATMAAAAGGITTIVVMPLNCTPAATTKEALLSEAAAAAGKCVVDHGFWGGVVPGNAGEIEGMWKAGALGFKCFMCPSGVDDFGFVSDEDLREAMPAMARLGAEGARPTLLVHAEDPGIIAFSERESGLQASPRSYARYLASRIRNAEGAAIAAMSWQCQQERMPVHIVHLADASSLRMLARSRAEGLPITVETCPHYLTFAAEEIRDGDTLLKCAPPIREGDIRRRLWNGLRARRIDIVATDHSPCPPSLKCLDTGDFSKAWGGISSLQVSLPAVWTGAQARGFALTDLARWMSLNPAKLAGLQDRKGRIAPGYDADLIAFDPDAQWTVDQALLHHRHKPTPYHGMQLRGRVEMTFLRGIKVFDRSQPNPFPKDKPGQWLTRTPTTPTKT
jgi:allantoinase